MKEKNSYLEGENFSLSWHGDVNDKIYNNTMLGYEYPGYEGMHIRGTKVCISGFDYMGYEDI